MLLLRKPEPAVIRTFVNAQAEVDFSYESVGATATEPPAGYVVDHTRGQLGLGSDVFNTAKSALEGWQQFDLGWLSAWPGDTPIQPGNTVAIVVRSMGCWWLNACRIVYLIDEQGDTRRWGFAYGTLADHVGSGEERFLVEMDARGTVSYDILAFSRLQHPLARIGYPWVRHVQRRFGRESLKAMRQRVATGAEAGVSSTES